MAHSLWSTVKQQRQGLGLSLVVPYRDGGCEYRNANYEWLRQYYESNLPAAQWVHGQTDAVPFNKSAAVNYGFRRAHGDIIVVLDADAFMDTQALLDAATEIRWAKRHGISTWIMPYRRLYRLTEATSRNVMHTHARLAWRYQWFGVPEDCGLPSTWTECHDHEYENHDGGNGHMFGAMVQVHPRECFEATGGWDERFCNGWGGEDISFSRAADTLYGRHRSLNYPLYHLWHPQSPGNSMQWSKSRSWEGQTATNEELSQRYFDATFNYSRMRALTDES